MAYTTADLVARVQRRVRDTAYPASEIKDYLTDEQSAICTEYDLPVMRTSQNYTVTTGVADITNGVGLPSNFDSIIQLSDTTNGQSQTIPYIDRDRLEADYPDFQDTTAYPNAQPLFWYWDAGVPKLFPAPAGAYTLKLRYKKLPTDLSDDAQVPDLPVAFREVLVEGASRRVLEVKDNYDQAAIHETKRNELLVAAMVRASTPQSGEVQVMGINRGPYAVGRIDSIRRIP